MFEINYSQLIQCEVLEKLVTFLFRKKIIPHIASLAAAKGWKTKQRRNLKNLPTFKRKKNFQKEKILI